VAIEQENETHKLRSTDATEESVNNLKETQKASEALETRANKGL